MSNTLRVEFARQYKKMNKNNVLITMFVYAVIAPAKAQEAFKAAQGDYHRIAGKDDVVPEGTVLWFTDKFIGDKGNILITAKNKVVPDMGAFEKMNSLAKQFGGDLGTELAKQAAQGLLGSKPEIQMENEPIEVAPEAQVKE